MHPLKAQARVPVRTPAAARESSAIGDTSPASRVPPNRSTGCSRL
jgi:hypothetical protein